MRMLLVVVLAAAGCGSSASVPDKLQGQWVYVDLKTGQTFLQQPSDRPPIPHPETGRRTLMPGLYCPQCKKWYPSPPLEERQRNPKSMKCPKDGGPLTADGPLPVQP